MTARKSSARPEDFRAAKNGGFLGRILRLLVQPRSAEDCQDQTPATSLRQCSSQLHNCTTLEDVARSEKESYAQRHEHGMKRHVQDGFSDKVQQTQKCLHIVQFHCPSCCWHGLCSWPAFRRHLIKQEMQTQFGMYAALCLLHKQIDREHCKTLLFVKHARVRSLSPES